MYFLCPNNMQFQNRLSRRHTYSINFILSGPARWSLLVHRSGTLYIAQWIKSTLMLVKAG